MEINKIYCGENLEVLKTFPDDSIDLIYLDPPFNTGRNFGEFNDKWNGGLHEYLDFMVPRIRELHRILKPIGSTYLHCDHHAVHYLKIEMDRIFGHKNFQSDITWRRCNGGKGSKVYSNNSDRILFYTRGTEFTFNKPYVAYSEKKLLRFKYDDHDGRGRYGGGHQLHVTSGKGYKYALGLGERVPEFGYRITEDEMQKRLKDNRITVSPGVYLTEKNYLSEYQGKAIDDIWDDFLFVMGNESIGYPTQKPESLLERIILASSNEGDVVLDPFSGSGTTLKVAKRLNRNFVGIDINPKSIDLCQGIEAIRLPVHGIKDATVEDDFFL